MGKDPKDEDINLEKLEQNYKQIEERSRNVQQAANENTKAAVIGQKQIQFLRAELPKYRAIGEAFPEFQSLVSPDGSWAQQALRIRKMQ